MTTKSALNNVRKAIKARLRLNNKQIDNLLALNWTVSIVGDMKGCIAVCEPKTDAENEYELFIMMKDRAGYYVTVQVYNLEDEHVARWKLLPLEEAYELPTDYAHRGSSSVWHDAKILAVGTDSIGFIAIMAEVEKPGIEGADISTGSSTEVLTLRTEEYVEDNDNIQDIVGKKIRLCIDMTPPKTESDIRTGQNPLPLIVTFDYESVE